LIGNNGSGKTTLLNLLSKKINPTAGSISQNKDINIAYLPQELYFNSDFSLKEFVVGNNSELIELDKRISEINDMLKKVQSEKNQFQLLDELEDIQYKKDTINILKLEINAEKIMKGLPSDTIFIGLSSIYWREAWKYGLRAFRYCHHDLGHAMAAINFSCACLGWRANLVDRFSTKDLECILGLVHTNENEVEVPDCLIAIIPNQECSKININKQFIADDFLKLTWHGIPNILSSDHLEWEGIQEASKSCEKPFTESHLNLERELEVLSDLLDNDTYPLQKAIHQRRSAVSMDRKTRIDRKTFYQFLIKTNPQLNPAPFQSFSWEPQVHLGLFVHRVNDLPTGLYLLVRNKKYLRELRENFKKEFLWEKPDFCPADLDLFLLEQGDYLGASKSVSCGQDIAGDGCFSLGMISAFEKPLTQYGSWFYPRLFWECGAIGQVLYLQAEVSGIRSTGIGCFFDDPVHDIFGIEDMSYQSLYHFTVGGPVEDKRLTTLPPY